MIVQGIVRSCGAMSFEPRSIAIHPEAIVELVMTLTASVGALRAEVDELKRPLGRDSRNSSLPPSRDSPAARA